jgi:6,7-dimethyl-8-ribityllumazine synthase
MLKFACVVSQFNEKITFGLLSGARNFLQEKGMSPAESDVYYTSGAFEIPLIAQALAKSKRYSGIICLGCVIQGDTAHFEFISLGATLGLIQSMLATDTPITFGILTTYNEDQAIERSQSDLHNKGREAAAACLQAAETLLQIQQFTTFEK